MKGQVKREMSESRGSVTCEDIFGEESSTSSTSDEEALTQTAEKARKPPGTAPARRMRLSLQQKLAAINHFQSNKMTHNELAQWMKKQFKLEKEINRSTITKMFRETELKRFEGFKGRNKPNQAGKKSSKETSFPELENKLFAWFRRNESKHAVLTDDVVRKHSL